jgi:hypothetical protein
MSRAARPVWFRFESGPAFYGVTDDTYWNGALNVRVTPKVRDRIVAWLNKVEPGGQAQEDMAALAPGEDGFIDLSNGYTAVETTPPRRPASSFATTAPRRQRRRRNP